MRTTIKNELVQSILDKVNDGILTDENKDDWHFYAFNEDYYILGYYNASEWLKRHNIDIFEAIHECNQYEIDNFGETSNKYDNSEITVNMLAYIYGEELIYNLEAKNIDELVNELETI